jgi:hypothetical protein
VALKVVTLAKARDKHSVSNAPRNAVRISWPQSRDQRSWHTVSPNEREDGWDAMYSLNPHRRQAYIGRIVYVHNIWL